MIHDMLNRKRKINTKSREPYASELAPPKREKGSDTPAIKANTASTRKSKTSSGRAAGPDEMIVDDRIYPKELFGRDAGGETMTRKRLPPSY